MCLHVALDKVDLVDYIRLFLDCEDLDPFDICCSLYCSRGMRRIYILRRYYCVSYRPLFSVVNKFQLYKVIKCQEDIGKRVE